MLKIVLIVLGVPVLISIGYFIIVIFSMLFVGQITDLNKSFSSEYEKLVEKIDVIEISNNEKALPYEYKPGTGDLPGSKEMVLLSGGKIEDTRRVFDNDPGKEVDVLIRTKELQSLVFKGNDVYQFDAFKLGKKIGSYFNPELKFVRHILPVNKSFVLVNGDRVGATYADPYLWQVNTITFDKIILAKDPYYSFERPPKVFMPHNFDGVVIVYYTGEYSYGFGGDSSRPKFSVVRVYTDEYPKGKDLVKFDFKAGTIVDVKWEDSSLILSGDPSKPGGEDKNRKPARVWKIKFKKNDQINA